MRLYGRIPFFYAVQGRIVHSFVPLRKLEKIKGTIGQEHGTGKDSDRSVVGETE